MASDKLKQFASFSEKISFLIFFFNSCIKFLLFNHWELCAFFITPDELSKLPGWQIPITNSELYFFSRFFIISVIDLIVSSKFFGVSPLLLSNSLFLLSSKTYSIFVAPRSIPICINFLLIYLFLLIRLLIYLIPLHQPSYLKVFLEINLFFRKFPYFFPYLIL